LTRFSNFPIVKRPNYLLVALVFIIAGCSLEKQSGFNRTMQNLTAHYNILFNAKEILRQKQESYATSFVDNYNEILNVYQDTTTQSTTPDKDMELAITKAYTIINIKEQSRYLGDAYLVLGKANYLEANYFNAVEFLGYVARSFPKRPDLTQDALMWKARALLNLNEFPQAKLTLDTAFQNINPKKKPPADIYAAKLQYDIDLQNYAEGEEMAKQAVLYCKNEIQRIRWTFILAQIQELNQKQGEAYKNYGKVAKSNASFEMAFNASLNRIRIEDIQNGVKTSKMDKLLALLKDPDNKDFTDQVYYQVAELYMAAKDIDNAVKYYKLSIRNSTKNQSQKGLSYLRLAEIYLKNKADYLTAKKYYDSTLTNLPVNYPGYQAIQKKGTNLQILADRLLVISREDTLQALAKMDEKTRATVIDKMVSDHTLQQQAIATANAGAATSNSSVGSNVGPGQQSRSSGTSSFYFYNTNAVSQGFSDFKRKWGNRKLEDNWRRSSRSGNDLTGTLPVALLSGDPDAPPGQSQNNKGKVTAGGYRQELLQGLPLTSEKLAQSNLRVYNAYIDIANFYRDILDDKPEAIVTYEFILKRFPDDPNKPAVYYNLYRLYSESNPEKSNYYKNILLKNYAETAFAKVISDPDFAKKLDEREVEFIKAYDQVFDLFAHGQYKDVITCVPELLTQYPNNKYSAQLYYLQAIAAGHFEKVGPFQDSLQQILKKFPDDRLVTPLIKQHLDFIKANQAAMLTRKVVFTDNDPQEVPFTLIPSLKEQTEFRREVKAEAIAAKPGVKPEDKKQQEVPAQPGQVVNNLKPTPAAAGEPNALFSMRDSTNYYFVVNVSTGTTNLSSSRFGIGQFNRANYAGRGIKHQLLPVGDDNQLIYVGRFLTLEGVKKYAGAIVPLLPEIMKVPSDKYSFFIITQENLNKLADKKLLDSYIDYYQKNY
jgi:tetratricopeptide (TPR) repeat protein